MRWMAFAMVLGVGVGPDPAEALWLDLGPAQISQAVAYGRAGSDVPSETFEREWRVRAVGGHGSATVDSEFLVVARAARELARRGNADSGVNLPETMCAFLSGPALYVAVTLDVRKGEEDDAIEARLEAGDRVIAPLDMWLRQLVTRDGPGDATSGVTVSHYLRFPVDGIDPLGQVTVVTSGLGGRTWRFPLDLKSMR